MQGHDIVLIGLSAGDIEPLVQIVVDLPSDLPAALFVMHHFPARSTSALPSTLAGAAELPARPTSWT